MKVKKNFIIDIIVVIFIDVFSTNAVTDIAIQNNTTEGIDFPSTCTFVIVINKITELSSEEHEHTS
ncbi:MAG: hypothetical protein WKF36_00595 [Candidatus Nitrosocosmicus sp.]